MVRGQKPLALYNVIQSLIINHDSFLLFFKQKFIAFDYGDGLPPEECSPRDFCSNFLPLHIIAGFLKNVLVIFELALQMEQDGGNLYIWKEEKKKEKRKKTINHHGYSPFSWGGLVSTRVFCCPRLRALQTTKRDPADDCNNESLVRRACCRRTLHRKSAIVPPPAVESNCGLSITFFFFFFFFPSRSICVCVCLSCVSLYPVFLYVFAFLSSILVSRSGDGHKEFSLFSSSLFSFFDCERFLARQGFATLPSARSI